MRIDIISAVPELLSGPFSSSIIKKSIDKELVEIHIHNLRDYSTNNYKSIDDYQYGGGAGMVMSIEPIDMCISKLKEERKYEEVIYMSPDGEKLNQPICNKLSCYKNIIILCGHYKGVDQRVRDNLITKEIFIVQAHKPKIFLNSTIIKEERYIEGHGLKRLLKVRF